MNLKTPMGVTTTKTTSKSRAILIERGEIGDGIVSENLKAYCDKEGLIYIDHEYRSGDLYCITENPEPTTKEDLAETYLEYSEEAITTLEDLGFINQSAKGYNDRNTQFINIKINNGKKWFTANIDTRYEYKKITLTKLLSFLKQELESDVGMNTNTTIKDSAVDNIAIQAGKIDPKELIETIRLSFVGAEETYTKGSCYKLYEILKLVYPLASPWYNEEIDHVATCIDGVLYDITGVVTGNYNPLYTFSMKIILSLHDAKYSIFNTRICPHCDEGIEWRGEK